VTDVHVFDSPGSVSLQIRLPSGRVVVTTTDEPRTTVELVPLGRRGPAALEEIDVRGEERQGRHVITIEQAPRFRWGPIQITWDDAIEARVTCPAGTDLDLAAGSTDLRADGELGEVSVKSASGDVELDRARGKLQVKSASGDIAIGSVVAEASLTTVSGEIQVRSLEGPVQARSVSGDVRVRLIRAPLTLSTTSGDIDLDRVEAGEVRVQTISGDARIGVGHGTRVWIDAASVSGTLESELGLEDQPSAVEGSSEAQPVVPLQVKTVSGDVSIVRAPAQAATERV